MGNTITHTYDTLHVLSVDFRLGNNSNNEESKRNEKKTAWKKDFRRIEKSKTGREKKAEHFSTFTYNKQQKSKQNKTNMTRICTQ